MTIFDDYETAVANEDWASALQHAQEIADQAPEFPTCWFNVGVCHDALSNHVEAARSFQRVISIDFSDARARFRMLRSLYLAGAIQVVHDEMTIMLDYDPGFVSEMFETEVFQELKQDHRFAQLLSEDQSRVARLNDSESS